MFFIFSYGLYFMAIENIDNIVILLFNNLLKIINEKSDIRKKINNKDIIKNQTNINNVLLAIF